MLTYRRCGVSLLVSAYLVLAPLVPRLLLAQAVTLVHTGTRSAGTGSAGYSGDYGAATTVSLNAPSYIAFDSNGNQYLSDTLNNCVRKIDTAGNITTVAGLAVSGQNDTCNTSSNATPTAAQGLYHPTGLAVDSANRLYIADSLHNCVRVLANGSTGVASLTTAAGTCGSDPTVSVTPTPNGLVLDASSNLYIALQDSTSAAAVNQVVRHASTDAAVSVCLVAGAASANVATACAGMSNGVALSGPSGLAIDVNNDLFIADTGNNCIREVAGLATQQTAVGQCLNDGTGSSTTTLRNPYGLAVSPTQALLIAESNPDNVVSYTPGSSLTLVAGLPSGTAGSYLSTQDGTSALNAPLNGPLGIAFDSLAHVFVADSGNNITRELSNNMQFAATPVGSASATLPITFVINQAVNLSAATGSDYVITSTTCSGALTPATAGAAPNTCQVFGSFAPSRPGLRRSALKLTDSTSGTAVFQGLQGTGTGALSVFTPGSAVTVASNLAGPVAIATDAAGNAYVLEAGKTTGSANLLELSGSATQTVIAAGLGLATPNAIAADAAGNWFVADAAHGSVARFGADGSVNTGYVTALDTPTALVADGFGNLYVAQAGGSHNVVEIYAAGARRVIAGSGSNSAADGVTAATAEFVSPSALTMDLNGKLYIADQSAHLVYAIDQSGIIHIAAGNGATALVAPDSLATDAAGDLYIADQTAAHIYVVYASATSDNMTLVLDGSGANGILAGGPLSIALDGNGNVFATNATSNAVIELNYSNPTLNFGTVNAGSTSAALVQQVGNIGTSSLNITSPFSTSDSHFAVSANTTTCGTSILPGSVCSLGFTFAPTAGVAYTASSIIASNSYNSPQPIQLLGNGKPTATLTVTLPAEIEVYGQPFNAAVIFNGTTIAPTGTISFSTSGKTLCSISGNFGASTTCNASNSGLGVGSYKVAFSYSGDNNYSAVTGTAVLTVTPSKTLVINVNSAARVYGVANPTFTGTVSGLLNDDSVTVTYMTTATTVSSAGRYMINASISGAAAANYSATINQGALTISPTATTTTMATSNASITLGDSVTFTAHVSSATGMASGTVNFYDGTTLLGKGSLSSGVTAYTTTALGVGTHSISAAFQASTNFNTSGSTALGEIVAHPVGSFVMAPMQDNQYIRGAGTTSYQINLQATGAFTGKINLVCSGLPADSTCSFSNPTPTLTAGSNTTVTMTVTNTVADAKLVQPVTPNPATFAPLTAAVIFPFELTGLGVCFSGLRRRSPASLRKHLLVLLFLAAGMVGLTGCGAVTTSFKTYTINVTGTSVNFPWATPQTTSVVLSVGQQVQ